MGKKNYYFLLMFAVMNIMAMATSTIKAETWDGSFRTVEIKSEDDQVELEFTASESKMYTFKSDTKEYGVKIKAVCGETKWSDAIYQWFGATVSIDAKANDVIRLYVSTDGEESFPVILPIEMVSSGNDDSVWDGTKKDITISQSEDAVTLLFSPAESKKYTFKCDTKAYATKIKATWEGLSLPKWSESLNDWAGATLTVDAVAGRTITLTVTAADEPEYPVTFPIEVESGIVPDVPGESWDGTTKAITLNNENDSKKFNYTATQTEILYIFSKASAYDVKFAGGIIGTEQILEWEAYDNMLGGYTSIKLMADDVLEFTVTSTDYLEGAGAGFPRTFTINSLSVPVSGFWIPGANFENAVKLEVDKETVIPVNENVSQDEFPLFENYSELSWLTFTPENTGLADIDIEEYVLFVYEGEDKIGALDYTPLRVIQDDETNSHKFAVKANTTYYVVTTNNRPTKATLKITKMDEGNDCILPINIDSKTSSISVKGGTSWYYYTVNTSDDHKYNILELSSNNDWEGTVSYFVDCSDAEPVVHSVNKTTKSYLELDPNKTAYIICVESNKTLGEAIRLVQREAKPGEAKMNPLVANLGDNSYGGEIRNYWFKYVPTKDCMLKISYPEDALSLIVLGTGTTNVANPNSTTCVVRVNAGEEYRMRFEAATTELANFSIEENEIPEGDYCDYPRLFNLNDDIVMKNRNAREEWYAFTAPDDGTVEFVVEDPIWVRDHWSCGIVKECGDRQDKLSYEERLGRLTYRYSVSKGQTYRFTVYQFVNDGSDIVINTKFVVADKGESCDKAIAVQYNEPVICKSVRSDTWYEFVAPQDGEYYLVGSLGQGATLSYKIDNCSANTVNATIVDYMYGRSYAVLNLTSGQVVKICAKISTAKDDDQDYDYSFVVRSKANGDDLETPFATESGKYYSLSAGNVTTAATTEGHPYSITAVDDKIQITLLTKEAYFGGNFQFYDGAERILVASTKTKKDNGDGTYTYVYTFTHETIVAGKAVTVLIPFDVDGFNLGSSLIVGLESTESSNSIVVYPNPCEGEFQVDLGNWTTDAAVIEIFNMAGMPVYRENATQTVTTVNLKGIAPGAYLVRVTANGKNTVAKLIVR